MGNDFVVPLQTLGVNDRAIGGGKAVNLALMMQQGLPVPDGFVVTTHAYRHYLDSCDIGADWPVERIRLRLSGAGFPLSIGGLVQEAHRSLTRRHIGELVYAVRSSATAEDTSGASFAGQHATYLLRA